MITKAPKIDLRNPKKVDLFQQSKGQIREEGQEVKRREQLSSIEKLRKLRS